MIAIGQAWHYSACSDLFMPYKMLTQTYLVDGQFAKSEAAARQAIEILQATNSHNMPQQVVCQFFWAKALLARGQLAEALFHARIADQEYAAMTSLQPIEKTLAGQTHQLLASLQSRLDDHRHNE